MIEQVESTGKIEPPVFVLDNDGWVGVYDSTEDALAHIESVDVEEGVFTAAYDSVGNPLTLALEDGADIKGRKTFFGFELSTPKEVVLRKAESEAKYPEQLKRILVRALVRSGLRAELVEKLSLPDLVREAVGRRSGRTI